MMRPSCCSSTRPSRRERHALFDCINKRLMTYHMLLLQLLLQLHTAPRHRTKGMCNVHAWWQSYGSFEG